MENEEKLKVFEAELGLIRSGDVRAYATWAVTQLPDYFFKIPAASTGKYHPQYAQGDGGLVRHTQAAVRILYTLLSTQTFGGTYTQKQKDMMVTALIVHDGAKSGIPKQRYTVHEHPYLICDHLEQRWLEDCEKSHDTMPNMESDDREFIYTCIRTHMGEWGKGFRPEHKPMPPPSSRPQGMVHLADYLASRKMLEFNFDAEV